MTNAPGITMLITSIILAPLVFLARSPYLLQGAIASAPTVDVEGVTGDEDRAAWAFAQFEAAGLTPVNFEVTFAHDPEPCRGHDGIHRFGDPHIVVICNPNEKLRSRTLVHELAHVWVAQNLDGPTRAQFLARRNLTTWHDPDVPWSERGTEHAAEIIAWGVSDLPCWAVPHTINGSHDIDTLAAQFEVLTGQAPHCDADADRPNQARERQMIE